MTGKSVIFLRKTVVLTTSCQVAPAALRTAAKLLMTCSVCLVISPVPIISPLIGSRGICPEAKRIFPVAIIPWL